MRAIASEIKSRLQIISGAAILAVMGRDRFYLAEQGNGTLAKVCRAFTLNPTVVKTVCEFQEAWHDRNAVARSAVSRYQYDGEMLGGWAAGRPERGDAHLPIQDQMRGLLLPRVEEAIARGAKRIVEVGAGDGALLIYLAGKYPSLEFCGVDFATSVPAAKAHPKNVTFMSGYALDLLRDGTLKGDVIFAASTFCVVTPAELREYATAIKQAGFSEIVLLDPASRRWTPKEYPGTSYHLRPGLWGHDYLAYFPGYKSKALDMLRYSGNKKRAITEPYIFTGRND